MITAMFLLSLSMIIPNHTYADTNNADNSNLARGAAIWANRCDSCHNMRSPSEFSAEQWRTIVQHMRLQAGLSGQQARDVYSFLAAQSQNTAVVTLTSDVASTSTNENDIDLGKKIYSETCMACHGSDGKGAIPGVPNMSGKDSPLANNSESVLLQRIKSGYHDTHSSIAMPAKGGNPSLTDEDLKAVLHYMKNTF
jgi:cytochrome c5